jgi:hypothetical protein
LMDTTLCTCETCTFFNGSSSSVESCAWTARVLHRATRLRLPESGVVAGFGSSLSAWLQALAMNSKASQCSRAWPRLRWRSTPEAEGTTATLSAYRFAPPWRQWHTDMWRWFISMLILRLYVLDVT